MQEEIKEVYEKPVMEVIWVEEDVITSSGCTCNSSLDGGNQESCSSYQA